MSHNIGHTHPQSKPVSNPAEETLTRLLVLKVGLLLFLVLVAVRLIHVQVIDAAK
ncbi:MAG: hypothetical protein HW412_1107, partial [Bacteroidetes bacterium]|nr:hypothetical protein [Bacteroidota bacterium]